MIKHLKHIISVFIFLSFLGLGGNIPIAASSVKYSKETEWVTNAGSSEKISKCFSYIQYIFDSSGCLILKPWSDEYCHFYHQKVKVQIISRKKIEHIITSKSLLLVKLYFSERSIEDYLVF